MNRPMSLPKPMLRPPFDITRASHVTFRVRDLGRARAFYVDALGLLVTEEGPDSLYLRGLEEACHHSIVLKRASAPGCEHIGFRVFMDDDLDRLAAHLKTAGVAHRFVDAPAQSRTLRFTDPVGTVIDVCASMQTRERAVNRFGLYHGVNPMRLDHFQVLTPAVETAAAFWAALGFRTSEYIVEPDSKSLRAVFMQRKGNPHDLVFMKAGESGAAARMHHVAFTCPEAHHLMHACDVLASAGFGDCVEHGPGRHFGPGYARFLYLRDPDGHRVEFFNNHYQTMDIEDEPLRWQGAMYGAGARWGRPPVASWRDEASAFVSA